MNPRHSSLMPEGGFHPPSLGGCGLRVCRCPAKVTASLDSGILSMAVEGGPASNGGGSTAETDKLSASFTKPLLFDPRKDQCHPHAIHRTALCRLQ
jgi:hypothetical protein